MANHYDDLKDSYGRCLAEPDFFHRFCERLLMTHPSVRRMFAQTDFETQTNALRSSISAAIWHASGNTLSGKLVDGIAAAHSRAGRAPVPPHLYAYWVESLLQTVAEVDPKITPRLLDRWREAMEGVTAAFAERY